MYGEAELYSYDSSGQTLDYETTKVENNYVSWWARQGSNYTWLRLDRRTLEASGTRTPDGSLATTADGVCKKIDARPVRKNQL
jgi:hypothetical protein